MGATGDELSITMALQSDSEHCWQQPPSLPPSLPWQGTPMKSTNRHSGYRSCVIEQKPQGSSRSRTGSRGLELKRVVEVAPNSPYHTSTPRAASAPRSFDGCKSITVRASDFIKYRDNPSMLRSCKIQPNEAATDGQQKEQPEPWVYRDPWKNVENPEHTRTHFDDAHLNQKWFPPSPPKECSEKEILAPTQDAVWQEAPEFSSMLRNSRPRSTSRELKRAGSRPLSACSTCDGSTSSNSDGMRTPRSARGPMAPMLPHVEPSQNKRTTSSGPRRASPDSSLTGKKPPPHSSRSPRDHSSNPAHSRNVSQDGHRELETLPLRASSRGRPPRPVSGSKPSHWR